MCGFVGFGKMNSWPTENSRRVPRNDLNIRHWHFITRPGLPRDQRQNNSTVAANEEQSERQVEIRHQARVAGGLPFLFILLPRRIIRLWSAPSGFLSYHSLFLRSLLPSEFFLFRSFLALNRDGWSERREIMIRWLMERAERIRLHPSLFRCFACLFSLELNRFFLCLHQRKNRVK